MQVCVGKSGGGGLLRALVDAELVQRLLSGKLDVVSQADSLQRPDDVPRHVKLREETRGRKHGERMSLKCDLTLS